MIADCNERQEARRELTTARALMKPTETNLIRDLVGALLGVFFLCGARSCIVYIMYVLHTGLLNLRTGIGSYTGT